tara:strand:+ start:4568 stop:5488 length:921 start_codon:yes stop_codon:yes gene_type:complete
MYNNLITRKFLDKEFNQDVSQLLLVKALTKCYKKSAFSTFPYINDKYNSEESIVNTNSGNCIALSMFLQKYLKNEYNLKSFLIPATIPNKYKHDGYLKISHVALAIPKNSYKYYIVDPAFYFLNPIKVKVNSNSEQKIFLKNIYNFENVENKHPKNYNSINKMISKISKLNKDLVYNEYQIIPKDTIYSECCYENDKFDTWRYFLVEILNPDNSITSFFINILNKPFICTTKLDKNNICIMEYYIKFLNNKKFSISKDNNESKIYNLDEISENTLKEKLKDVEENTKKYFINGITYEIIKYYNNNK